MRDFDDIKQQVLEQRYGTLKAFNQRYKPISKKPAPLRGENSEFLANMTWRIFCAGLNRKVVDAKWPAFQQAFFNFQPLRVAMMSDEEMDALMANRNIIRHWGKIQSVRTNASMLVNITEEYDSVAAWLNQWPVTDIVGLWIYLRKQGAQLGGNSAAYFLRISGKDTFILTKDVATALISQGIVDKHPASQRDLYRTQQAFNHWREQSGWSLQAISLLLAQTVNY